MDKIKKGQIPELKCSKDKNQCALKNSRTYAVLTKENTKVWIFQAYFVCPKCGTKKTQFYEIIDFR